MRMNFDVEFQRLGPDRHKDQVPVMVQVHNVYNEQVTSQEKV